MGSNEIIRWQELIGVVADGDFGPVTLARSREIASQIGLKPVESSKPWLDLARGELGQKEVQGGENPRIVEYHSVTTLKATEDEVPWCSAFVSWCLEKAWYKSTHSAWARSYESYGQRLADPRDGCIVVFDWGNGSGHVGFVVGWTNTTVSVLGGNQSNSVCIATFNRGKVSGWRWPVK
jgi:uncharacterized protein (TIGR02594 family)